MAQLSVGLHHDVVKVGSCKAIIWAQNDIHEALGCFACFEVDVFGVVLV